MARRRRVKEMPRRQQKAVMAKLRGGHGGHGQSTRWFHTAVHSRPPYDLGGWSKSQKASTRRRLALSSRPKSWSPYRRYLSAARALQALANVQQDAATRSVARSDAKYFFKKAKEAKSG